MLRFLRSCGVCGWNTIKFAVYKTICHFDNFQPTNVIVWILKLRNCHRWIMRFDCSHTCLSSCRCQPAVCIRQPLKPRRLEIGTNPSLIFSLHNYMLTYTICVINKKVSGTTRLIEHRYHQLQKRWTESNVASPGLRRMAKQLPMKFSLQSSILCYRILLTINFEKRP